MQKRFIFICFFLLLKIHITAQTQGKVYEIQTTANVEENGKNILIPWCGGVNSVQVNHADLNNDGKKDLVLFDNNNGVTKTFLNIGNTGDIKYTYAPKYEENFPKVYSFMAIRDYNCDNVPDLISWGSIGLPCYRGYYQNNELKFTFFRTLWAKRISVGDTINIYSPGGSIPSVEDIDNDGDLDIIAVDVSGVFQVFYKNMRVEQNLNCESMQFSIADKCWGKFFQGATRTFNLNATCSLPKKRDDKTRDPADCILHFDYDGDGDMDVMYGNAAYSDVQLLYNNGSDVINAQDTLFQNGGHQFYMPKWVSPFYVDIDNDNKKDLIFTTHNDDNASANLNSIAWYKNTGTTTSPTFQYQNDSLLTPEMIDVGSCSTPTFFDFNKDGKKDLFIGNEGYLNNNTLQFTSQLAYYENTSSVGNISFKLITKDFLNLSTQNYQGIFPTFGDVTKDGIDDLILGNKNGNLAIYKNTASNNSLAPLFIKLTDSLAIPKVSAYSFPIIYDYNNDGKNDIIVGKETGKIVLYEDSSSSSTPAFFVKTNNLGGIKAGGIYAFKGYATPCIAKIDNLDTTYLMLGNADGTIEKYDSIFQNLTQFHKRDSNYSLIQTAPRSAPAITDIDKDGKYDMIIGNKLGGLYLFKQVLNIDTSTSISNIEFNTSSVIVYPNPTSSQQIYLSFNDNLWNKKATLILQNMMGEILMKKNITIENSNSVQLPTRSKGIYFLEIVCEQQRVIKKIVLN